MNNVNLYLGLKIIEETVRGTHSAFYRPAYLAPRLHRLLDQPQLAKVKECHCMQVTLARTALVKVELCS